MDRNTLFCGAATAWFISAVFLFVGDDAAGALFASGVTLLWIGQASK